MFSINPKELEMRRKRCRSALDNWGVVSRAPHTCCNICGCRRQIILGKRDRYDFPVRTALCPSCGLIYLVDRLNPEAYSEFYGSGRYRFLTGQFCGRQSNIEDIRRDQLNYAASIVDVLESCNGDREHRSLLDVGGSAGVVAATVASRLGWTATVLDPAVEEIAAAKALGIEGVVGSLETYAPGRKFDVILLCRSIEHLFDLRSSLLNIRELLEPDGLFYCDVIDFVESCRLQGAPEAITKIDHCYWLCHETAPRIFEAVGFEIICADVYSRAGIIGYLMRPCEPREAQRTAETTVDGLIRRLLEIASEWKKCQQHRRGIVDRLRWTAYRAKRKVCLALNRTPAPSCVEDKIANGKVAAN